MLSILKKLLIKKTQNKRKLIIQCNHIKLCIITYTINICLPLYTSEISY